MTEPQELRVPTDLVTAQEAAQLLRFHERTIKLWYHKGRLVNYSASKRGLRFSLAEVMGQVKPGERKKEKEKP